MTAGIAEATKRALVCPCCGGRHEEFLPAGGVRKVPNRKCPGCGSLERHRAIWLYLVNRTDLLRRPMRMLDFAPTPALRALLRKLPHLHYITADLDPRKADLAMDITDILFRDGCFDAILCVHVLEHIPDDRRAMRELLRVLRPGCWAILQSPVDPQLAETYEDPSVCTPEDRARLFGQRDHVRAYGRDYADRLRAAGFEVNVDGWLRTLGPRVAARHRLGSELDIYCCTKPI